MQSWGIPTRLARRTYPHPDQLLVTSHQGMTLLCLHPLTIQHPKAHTLIIQHRNRTHLSLPTLLHRAPVAAPGRSWAGSFQGSIPILLTSMSAWTRYDIHGWNAVIGASELKRLFPLRASLLQEFVIPEWLGRTLVQATCKNVPLSRCKESWA